MIDMLCKSFVPLRMLIVACEDQLGMSLGAEYYSKWVANSWPGWKQWCCDRVGLASGMFIPSRQALKGEQDERKAAEEFCLGAPALLLVLARMSLTLKGAHIQKKAAELGERFVQQCCLSRSLVWPASVEQAGPYMPLSQPLASSTAIKG